MNLRVLSLLAASMCFDLPGTATSQAAIEPRTRVCRPVVDSALARLAFPFVQESIPGRYDLTVIASRALSDTLVTGGMTLVRAESIFGPSRGSRLVFPLVGWSNLALAQLADVSLAYSPASTDERRPGVEAIYDGEGRTLTLVFGNGGKAVSTDAGVFFRVVSVDSSEFRGLWKDGGFGRGGGYFCARRIGG